MGKQKNMFGRRRMSWRKTAEVLGLIAGLAVVILIIKLF